MKMVGALIMILSLFAGCSDDGGSDDNGGTSAQTLEWPVGFLYQNAFQSSVHGTIAGQYSMDANQRSIDFTRNGEAYGSGGSPKFKIRSIEGKKITVQCTYNFENSSQNFRFGYSYTFCTDYSISENTITISGSNVLPMYGDASSWPDTVVLTRRY